MNASASSSDLCLVVDGGGTKTDCQVVRRDGERFTVVAQGRSSGCNPNAIGTANATTAIAEAIEAARKAAGLPDETRIARAAIAVAGTVDETRRKELEHLLRQQSLAGECRVFPDVLPILYAAATTGTAAGLISGTGATAIARNAHGKCFLAGGWGYLLGDEGSGFSVGREAVRQTLLELEMGAGLSLLGQCVTEQLEASSVAAIKKTVYQPENQRDLLASLAPAVAQCAKAEDKPAITILEQTIEHLLTLLHRAVSRLTPPGDDVPVAVMGGMFRPGSPLRQPLERAILRTPGYASVRFVDEPLECVHHLLHDEAFSRPILFAE